MNRAIELSSISTGGPFGAVIVDSAGNIVGEGHNEVAVNNDPTAHAEVVAIRRACANSNNFSLAGCTIYTSCEPCPMCLAACYWARLVIGRGLIRYITLIHARMPQILALMIDIYTTKSRKIIAKERCL